MMGSGLQAETQKRAEGGELTGRSGTTGAGSWKLGNANIATSLCEHVGRWRENAVLLAKAQGK